MTSRTADRCLRQSVAAPLMLCTCLTAWPAEPPECNDQRILANIKSAHVQVVRALDFPTLLDVSPRQTHLVPYVPSLDSPRNRKLLGGYPWSSSRFCTASLALEGGQTDTVFYRIDGRKDGPEDQYMFTPCFASVATHYSREHKEEFNCSQYQQP